ncbi:MAG TPA: radical SAM protein [Candidatus Cloacimonadota bacterium]|nr:radical SAM protein [Candidatus Cloacimonadota bacterium]
MSIPANSQIDPEISEIFFSIQGESSYAGRPCIFIRFSDCNLNCTYCDTRYAFSTGKKTPIATILSEIAKYPSKLVEITGGEPVLQEEATDALFTALNAAGYTILLETNGSLYLGDIPDYVVKIVDVKTPGSGFGESFMKWNLKFLNEQDELKFVITSPYDYSFAREFIETNALRDRMIHFSPYTLTLPAQTLAEWILRDGLPVRLHLQLHKLLNVR